MAFVSQIFGSIQLREIWEVIETFTATFDDDTKDFNIDPPFDGVNDSMLVFELDAVWAGIDNIAFRVNNLGTGYFSEGRTIKGGVETIIDINNAQFITLATSALVTQNNDATHIIAYIQLNKSGANQTVGCQSFANGLTVKGNEVISTVLTTNVSNIFKLAIEGNADFKPNSRMTLYRIKRKL